MDNQEAINRLDFIRCALLGGTKPQIQPNETNVELFSKAIEAIDTIEKIKEIIREEENYPISNSLTDPHPNEQDYNKVHAEKFNRIWKIISDTESQNIVN